MDVLSPFEPVWTPFDPSDPAVPSATKRATCVSSLVGTAVQHNPKTPTPRPPSCTTKRLHMGPNSHPLPRYLPESTPCSLPKMVPPLTLVLLPSTSFCWCPQASQIDSY